MNFGQLLHKYRQISSSERDKGNRFERLMQVYLRTDPKYAYEFKKIWLWNEFPGRVELGAGDTGIDLVGLTHQGDYWAIQCKCYQEDAVIDKPEVDSFLSTSGRDFKDENKKKTRFAQRMWISTTNRWGPNANAAISNQNPPVTRVNLQNLIDAPVDWQKLDEGIHGEASRVAKKKIKPHQTEAVERSHAYFRKADRGKLIMACGTGKTFTSLRIAEKETKGKGLILFLVPSIALLGQTLDAWYADAEEPLNAICICSDPEVSRKKSKDEDRDTISVVDLALPASTDPKFILHQFEQLEKKSNKGMTVVFSTYQSIDVVADTQKRLLKKGYGEFDLIVCDEAHRTTGVTQAGEDASAFIKVHDDKFIKAKKRLYMTATPRLYSDDAKGKAAELGLPVASMDDPKLYGEEIYRIGFGEAVELGLLTDYKVLILTLNDKDVPEAYRKVLTQEKVEISTDDASKLIGTINALSKQFLGDEGKTKATDPEPMRRAVAFCQNISVSRKITNTYNVATDAYLDLLPLEKKSEMVSVESRHIDGTMSAPQRDEMLSWLKASTDGNTCRILTNVRCLSEGVDVPSLDAVLFLSAKNSQVDVVQSVGRVMRTSPGKKYGYIIIPVVVPSDVDPSKALDDNERYKVVWTVLNALRAHDDRFNATINKIDLNKKRPQQILVGRPEYTFDGDDNPWKVSEDQAVYETKDIGRQMGIEFEQLQSVVFARLVQKVGDRGYWEHWASDVALIAARQIERIKALVEQKASQRQAFEKFLAGLQRNINPSITAEKAIEMLAQHIITRPVFEALFQSYSFASHNAVSVSMQAMLDALDEHIPETDMATLQRFYDDVREKASGIDNAEGRQRIVIKLYDHFFKAAFPKMAEQLGIVYTPVEVVDFILQSVDDVLKQEFGRSLSDQNVHILDPFTGTGTFITRMLQKGLIDKKDLRRKYRDELHANEIVLLAYYIAAVNIEHAFHDLVGEETAYEPFKGIVLTDTFQLDEAVTTQYKTSDTFTENSERIARQKNAPVRVILGNPPYSVGQKSANDNAQNLDYPNLDARIAATYAKATDATNKNSLYDSYIRAFRWATDRLSPQHGGIVAFVSNAGWLDGNTNDGMRKVLEREFSSIWIFNLRGNQRTSGELSRKEGGKVFGSGSRTPIAITLMVKKPNESGEKAVIRYHDIGDYLSREEKLAIVSGFESVSNPKMDWKVLKPNEHGDWITQRSTSFSRFIPLGDKDDSKRNFFNPFYSRGLATARDAYIYRSSKNQLEETVLHFINYYNDQRTKFLKSTKANPKLSVDEFLDFDTRLLTWNRGLKNDLVRNKEIHFDHSAMTVGLYRPFYKQHVYFAKELNDMVYQIPKLFPDPASPNLVICVSANYKDGSVLMTDVIPDLHLNGDTQAFPLFYYEEGDENKGTLFDSDNKSRRKDGISDYILGEAQSRYGKTITKEDIFYYVYGFLHSNEYRTTFANDLKKMLPRIPLVEKSEDFFAFSKAGRKLAELHVGYEKVPAYKGVVITNSDDSLKMGADEYYRVEKMRFPKKGQTDTIIYNSRITISNIPAKAYEYAVNGKSAIEWIMERYQVTVHPESGIKNDPNDWSAEVGNPRYVLDLLLSIINVSVQTVDIVNSLPKLSFDEVMKQDAKEEEIKELDVVVSKVKLGEVKAGSRGTAVHVFNDGEAFLVEFIQADGSSAVEMAKKDQLEKASA